MPAQPLPAGDCHQTFELAEATAPAIFRALLSHADQQRADGQLEGAAAALACAAARVTDEEDSRSRYELVRRRGLIEYADGRPTDALASFECALSVAEHLGDKSAIAKQLKNVGSSLRRIGDYSGAMHALSRGLTLQHEIGDAAIGPVLNNIADVYRDLEQPDEAERYYRQALSVFRSEGHYVQAMHVYDSLSALALDRGDATMASELLNTALHDLRLAVEGGADAEGARRYQLLVLAGLAQASLSRGDVTQAREQVAEALALADAHRLPLPGELELQAARVDRLSGAPDAALTRLRTALDSRAWGPAMQAQMLREISLGMEQAGQPGQALSALREAYEREVEDLRAQRDRGLAWSNARFNLSESRRQLAEAEERARHRTLQLWLILVSSAALLAVLILLFWHRQQRMRVMEAARRERYEQALQHYQREANTLAQDRQLLQALLDSREDAVALLDAEGQVSAISRAACRAFNAPRESLEGQSLPDYLQPADAAELRAALERLEDAGSHSLLLSVDGRTTQAVELRPWEGGDGLIVLELQTSPTPASELQSEPTNEPAGREEFRRHLVELMLLAVEGWERCTGLNRIELAERSRIWRVNIDDGRLRARAMERYLSLSKLPKNPRWRDVLRTAYYVLGNGEKMPDELRVDLQQRIDLALAFTRRIALGD
ncbi:tetratricopeptide repeat protein [Pseudomarimonas arenosa]|uniref:Tetratricopeptide repeat protein n=1 Tax=Pseudomarimonas arenosa TaxID=2774145 RepID=A0AAW3ZD69_9GAMM|nr:tetratricopeptide repeat protein [Pseudomarimonas arenosa]MBD8524280.1 tetratricopeptide repeat protein [Pseudomarimonas arenosa]